MKHLAPPPPNILNPLTCVAEGKTGESGAPGTLGEDRALAHPPVLTLPSVVCVRF